LSLLDAESTQQTAAESERDVYVAVIAFYKALGGVASLHIDTRLIVFLPALK
jgi:hypothetical protein